MGRVETGVDVAVRHGRPDEERGDDQDDDGECQLHDGDSAEEPRCTARSSACAETAADRSRHEERRGERR